MTVIRTVKELRETHIRLVRVQLKILKTFVKEWKACQDDYKKTLARYIFEVLGRIEKMDKKIYKRIVKINSELIGEIEKTL